MEDKDEIDAYLQRFERFARANEWDTSTWAASLSALLTGKALEAYSRLPDEDANDYEKLKEALFKRYNLTEEGYRNKFRKSIPMNDESPE